MERLWRTVKYEEVYLKAYMNGQEAKVGIYAYFHFYNTQRRKSLELDRRRSPLGPSRQGDQARILAARLGWMHWDT